MSGNSFELRQNYRQQHLKEQIELPVSSDSAHTVKVALPPPKPKRKQCSLYLDLEMMDRVKSVARQRGVTIGAVIEACVKMSLDRLEG